MSRAVGGAILYSGWDSKGRGCPVLWEGPPLYWSCMKPACEVRRTRTQCRQITIQGQSLPSVLGWEMGVGRGSQDNLPPQNTDRDKEAERCLQFWVLPWRSRHMPYSLGRNYLLPKGLRRTRIQNPSIQGHQLSRGAPTTFSHRSNGTVYLLKSPLESAILQPCGPHLWQASRYPPVRPQSKHTVLS